MQRYLFSLSLNTFLQRGHIVSKITFLSMDQFFQVRIPFVLFLDIQHHINSDRKAVEFNKTEPSLLDYICFQKGKKI